MTLTTVKEVWQYSFLFYSLAFLLNAKNLPNTSNFAQNYLLNKEFSISIIFWTLLGVWITGWNTVSCIWYITSLREIVYVYTFWTFLFSLLKPSFVNTSLVVIKCWRDFLVYLPNWKFKAERVKQLLTGIYWDSKLCELYIWFTAKYQSVLLQDAVGMEIFAYYT